jgi:FkbM family methyltransferase
MFRWRNRRTPLAPQPPPASVPEPQTPPQSPENDLLAAQVRILGRDSALSIVDAGAQQGQTTEEYVAAFPNCRVIALEPESANHAAAAERLAPFGGRVELLRVALAGSDGTADLLRTSHSGAHSLLEVGDMRHYDVLVDVLAPERIETVTLDRLCAQRGIVVLDVLKMDIQGGELMALQGAASLLARGAIRLIALEVAFQPLYRQQPMFWDLQAYLHGFGYSFQGLYDPKLHVANPAILRWADAIFVAPGLAELV